MKHLLITKFAVQFAPDNPRKRFEEDPTWLDGRMALFKKYCLPSVQAQTNKDFEWIFVVSSDFKNIDKYAEELLNYGKVLWVDAPWRDGLGEIGSALEPFYKNQGWICTTRLDSDDMIKNRFMEELSYFAEEVDRESWLSFFLGYYLHKETVIVSRVPPNPFISFVEDSDNGIKSVYCVDPHINITKYANRNNQPLIDIGKSSPAWVHVFHGNNIKGAKVDSRPWPEYGRGPAAELLKDFTYEST